MADYAIHDTTLIGTSNIIRKKEGSSALIDPADYPKRINLMGLLEEKTASGSIVTFSDGADNVPVKSCEVALSPSLDGYSSVDVVQTGKNLVDIPDSAEITRSQLTSTISPLLNDFLHGKKGNYTISAKTAGTVENANFITIRINYTDSTSSSNVYMYRGSAHESGGITGTFSISTDPTKVIDSVSFGGNTGTAKCAVSEWQIEATAQVTTYEPYVAPTTHTASLGRTIYGGSADLATGEGRSGYIKYVIDGVNVYGYLTGSNNMNIMPYGLNIDGTISKWLCDPITASGTNFGYNSSQGFIFIRQAGWSSLSGVTDAETFNAYCQEHPITLILPLATPTDFTFEPVEINSRLGANTMWSDGNMEVTYRASGTVTPIVPTLISKTITANGTYTASDDGVDGYDEVVVNVAQDESAFLVNDTDWSTSGLTYSKTVTIEEAGDYKIEWSSYSDEPTIQVNGVTQSWTYSKSDRYAWYLSETVTLAVGDTISFSLNANGNNAFIAQVISLSYHGNEDDFLGIQDDYTRYNVQNLYSSVYIENGAIKRQIVFQLNTGSGYEGFCVSLDGLGLTEGQTYTMSFVLDVPSSVTFSGSYQWGIKHSTSRLPASGSANSNTFNTSTAVDFVEQTGTQNVSITFTAGATNYLIVLLARVAGSRTEWIKMRDVRIEEASASLLSMMPSEEVNENTEEVENNEQNESEG